MILALDVGTTETGYCKIEEITRLPIEFDKISNKDLLHKMISTDFLKNIGVVVYEKFVSYGAVVGSTTLESVQWNGRFIQAVKDIDPTIKIYNVSRIEERKYICNSMRAGDTEVKHALIERFAVHDKKLGKGTKKYPDFFYGFAKDMWSAYAVGTVYLDLIGTKEEKEESD